MAFIRDKANTIYTLYRAIIHLIVIVGNGHTVCWMKAVLVDYRNKPKSVKLGASNWYTSDSVYVSCYICIRDVARPTHEPYAVYIAD